jgi:hypothetical protein
LVKNLTRSVSPPLCRNVAIIKAKSDLWMARRPLIAERPSCGFGPQDLPPR